jgi:hypothetical protein
MGNTFKKKHPYEHLTKPSGLYTECAWKESVIAKYIYTGVIAPRYPGHEDEESGEDIECPICFLNYPTHGVNTTRCCKTDICTECVLQVMKPTGSSTCPLCNDKFLKLTPKIPCMDRPEQFGLDYESFNKYVERLRKAKEASLDDRSPSRVVTATIAERAEHQEMCSELNKRAEQDRHTSPLLAPYGQSQTSGRVPGYSLDSSPRRHSSSRRRGSGSIGSSPRTSRARSLRHERERAVAANAFGIPTDLANMLTANNIDDLMVAEAIRRSMADTAGGTAPTDRHEDSAKSSELETSSSNFATDSGTKTTELQSGLDEAIRLSLQDSNEEPSESTVEELAAESISLKIRGGNVLPKSSESDTLGVMDSSINEESASDGIDRTLSDPIEDSQLEAAIRMSLLEAAGNLGEEQQSAYGGLEERTDTYTGKTESDEVVLVEQENGLQKQPKLAKNLPISTLPATAVVTSKKFDIDLKKPAVEDGANVEENISPIIEAASEEHVDSEVELVGPDLKKPAVEDGANVEENISPIIEAASEEHVDSEVELVGPDLKKPAVEDGANVEENISPIIEAASEEHVELDVAESTESEPLKDFIR